MIALRVERDSHRTFCEQKFLVLIGCCWRDSPQITSRAHKAVKGKMLNSPRPSYFFKFCTRIELCLSKISTKSSRILKWKAEVRTFLRLIHFCPVDVKSPVLSHGLMNSYSSLFEINFMLVSATCELATCKNTKKLKQISFHLNVLWVCHDKNQLIR